MGSRSHARARERAQSGRGSSSRAHRSIALQFRSSHCGLGLVGPPPAPSALPAVRAAPLRPCASLHLAYAPPGFHLPWSHARPTLCTLCTRNPSNIRIAPSSTSIVVRARSWYFRQRFPARGSGDSSAPWEPQNLTAAAQSRIGLFLIALGHRLSARDEAAIRARQKS